MLLMMRQVWFCVSKAFTIFLEEDTKLLNVCKFIYIQSFLAMHAESARVSLEVENNAEQNNTRHNKLLDTSNTEW